MKRYLSWAVLLTIFVSVMQPSGAEAAPAKSAFTVQIDNREVEFGSAKPYLDKKSGAVMLPYNAMVKMLSVMKTVSADGEFEAGAKGLDYLYGGGDCLYYVAYASATADLYIYNSDAGGKTGWQKTKKVKLKAPVVKTKQGVFIPDDLFNKLVDSKFRTQWSKDKKHFVIMYAAKSLYAKPFSKAIAIDLVKKKVNSKDKSLIYSVDSVIGTQYTVQVYRDGKEMTQTYGWYNVDAVTGLVDNPDNSALWTDLGFKF